MVILFEVEKRLKLNLAEDSKEDDLEGKVSGLTVEWTRISDSGHSKLALKTAGLANMTIQLSAKSFQ